MLILRVLSVIGGGVLLLAALLPGTMAVHAGQLWWRYGVQDELGSVLIEVGGRFFTAGEIFAGAVLATVALIVAGALLVFGGAVASRDGMRRCPIDSLKSWGFGSGSR